MKRKPCRMAIGSTVRATVAAPPRACRSMTKNQTDQKVEFGMRIAHGAFQGTLNREGNEPAGQSTHEAKHTPLTLRKK